MAPLIQRLPVPFRSRAALGLRPLFAPLVIFIPLGVALGPLGAGFVSIDALGRFDAVISVALATLGVFVGVAAGQQRGEVRLAFASATEGAIAMLVVGAALLLLLTRWQLPTGLPPLVTALVLAICAAASAAPAVDGSNDYARIAARVADLDDVLPIVVGGIALALIAPHTGPAGDVLLTIWLGIVAAATGWLLIERTSGAERGVFVLGTLALLGGGAAYIGTSPLLAGTVAGWFWALTPGRCDRVVVQDVAKVQQPLVMLMLFVAGASLVPTLEGVWLFAPYVVFRLAGKLLGGWVASRMARPIASSDLGAYLVTPGVIGIAFALNVQQLAPQQAGAILFAVSLGAITSEVLAIVVAPSARPD